MTLSHYADPYVELHSSNRITKAAIRSFIRYIGERDYTHCTSEDWIEFFKIQPRASMATLRRYRSTLITFLQWVESKQETDVSASLTTLRELSLASVVEESTPALLNGYFGSYDELMDTAEQVLRSQGDDVGYAPILYTMFTLVWYGMQWKDALDVRKDEVVFSDGLCIIQERYQIRHPRAIQYIKTYLEAALAYDINNRAFSYKPSEWLFRSPAASHITVEALANRIARINSLADGELCFSFAKIRESASFVKAYAIISNMGIAVTPVPHPSLMTYFSRLFEFTSSELTMDRYRNEAWELFYHWCAKFRQVSA